MALFPGQQFFGLAQIRDQRPQVGRLRRCAGQDRIRQPTQTVECRLQVLRIGHEDRQRAFLQFRADRGNGFERQKRLQFLGGVVP